MSTRGSSIVPGLRGPWRPGGLTDFILRMVLGLALLAVSATAVRAQPVQVFTELAEIDPVTGKVNAPKVPREVLSPAVVRNGYTSFQIVVKADTVEPWRLYLAQNPDGAAKAELYRVGADGNTLTRVTLPLEGTGTAVFWVDLYFETFAPAQRVKIEPQLRYRNDWVIYPMEARIMRSVVPADAVIPKGTQLPIQVMRGFLCGTRPDPAQAEPVPAQPTVASLRFRNAQQDRAMAPKADRAELQQRFGSCEATPEADDPEAYLRVRDFLIRLP